MKTDTHPQYTTTHVHCTSCNTDFDTRSTTANETITLDVCSNCHPFYTGKQRILDSGGRVQRFRNRQQARENR